MTHRKLTAAALALGLAAALGGAALATNAAFTDEAYMSASPTTGTLDIKLNGADHATQVAAMPLATLGGAYEPGTVKTQTLTLRNEGTIPTTVDITQIGDSALGAKLQIEVKNGETVLYSGLAASGQKIGEVALGAETDATVSIKVTAPVTLANVDQGQTATLTFGMSASQTSLK